MTYNFDVFFDVVHKEIEKFPTVVLARKASENKITITDYHKFLRIVFHQTFNAAASFAMAGGCCSPDRYEIRDYLIKHAEEERNHWQWVLGDLEKTGYGGPDLRLELPSPRVSAYIAFNFYSASRCPVARLGNAAVLEGIGATHAKKYANMIADQLKLNKDQLVFAFGHSDTDVGHANEIFKLLKKANINNDEWAWIIRSAETSAMLYRDMYNE